MVKVIIFDFDNTLVSYNKDHAITQVAQKISRYYQNQNVQNIKNKLKNIIDIEKSKNNYVREKWWLKYDSNFPSKILTKLTSLYWKAIMKSDRPVKCAKQILKNLKKRGYLLVLLTNSDEKKGIKKKRISKLSLTKYFDHIIICGEDIKEKKPNEKPYKIILKKLKIQPDEVLVIGDKPLVDLAPAQKLGINTVCLSRKTQIKWSTKIRSLNEIFSILQPK